MKEIETKKRQSEESDRILTPDEYKEVVKQRNKRIQKENADLFKEYAKLVRKEIVAKLSSGKRIDTINVRFRESVEVPKDFIISKEYQELKEEFKSMNWKLDNLIYSWHLTAI